MEFRFCVFGDLSAGAGFLNINITPRPTVLIIRDVTNGGSSVRNELGHVIVKFVLWYVYISFSHLAGANVLLAVLFWKSGKRI